MKQPDLMPDYKANLPRTGHNLSHDLAFTTSCGYLSPVFHDFLNPGETVTLGVDFKVRTQPLEAAAMSKLKVHTEYFFVPFSMLYQPFDAWYYGISDQYSSSFATANLGRLPTVDLQAAASTIWTNRNVQLPYGETKGRSFYRLMELFGFQMGTGFQFFVGSGNTLRLFPYQLFAYQCIYQKYYRLDTREQYHQAWYNMDQFYNSGTILSTIVSDGAFMHLRPLGSDYFTDIKVSPIVDVLNLSNKNFLDVAKQWLTRSSLDGEYVFANGSLGSSLGIGDGSISPFDSITPNTDVVTQFGFNRVALNDTDTGNVSFANGLDIGTANIRAMFASEKLWSVTGRAKKNYDAQTLAHFGFEVPHDVKHEISCFGHDINEIFIGEVISTSNTASGGSGSPLGEIAGKGYGASQGPNRHKFTAPCHGVVMAIYSIVPEEYYDPTFAKFNKLSTRDDLYTPEYDHLGMQPLFGYECDPTLAAADSNEIVGWQYRYEQWKRRWNRCTSIFDGSVNGSLASWFHTIKPYFEPANASDVGSANTESYQYFYHRPNELNDLFLYQFSGSWSSAYDTNLPAIYEGDPFVVAAHIDCVKVSTMSDYSLPRLDA